MIFFFWASAASQVRRSDFSCFFSNRKNRNDDFFLLRSNLAEPLKRRMLPGNGEMSVETTEASFYDGRKQSHCASLRLRCQFIRSQ